LPKAWMEKWRPYGLSADLDGASRRTNRKGSETRHTPGRVMAGVGGRAPHEPAGRDEHWSGGALSSWIRPVLPCYPLDGEHVLLDGEAEFEGGQVIKVPENVDLFKAFKGQAQLTMMRPDVMAMV